MTPILDHVRLCLGSQYEGGGGGGGISADSRIPGCVRGGGCKCSGMGYGQPRRKDVKGREMQNQEILHAQTGTHLK